MKRDTLEELMAKRTWIIIAHRLSSIRNADAIFVTNHGREIEMGAGELVAWEGA